MMMMCGDDGIIDDGLAGLGSKLKKGLKKLGKAVEKVAKKALPVAASFVPGVGAPLSKALTDATSAKSGGGSDPAPTTATSTKSGGGTEPAPQSKPIYKYKIKETSAVEAKEKPSLIEQLIALKTVDQTLEKKSESAATPAASTTVVQTPAQSPTFIPVPSSSGGAPIVQQSAPINPALLIGGRVLALIAIMSMNKR